MKKIISLLLILVMLISFSACKRAPDNTSDEEIAVAGGESDKVIDSTPEEQEQEVQTPTEDTEQKDAQTPDEDTEQKQEEQTPAEDTQKQEQNNTEAQKPVEEDQVSALKYPELQKLNQELRKNIYANDNFPTDVYVAEYLPLKLGYVEKIEKGYDTFCYNAKEDFSTKEPITEQMVEAASKYPYSSYDYFDSNYYSLKNYIGENTNSYFSNLKNMDKPVLSKIEENFIDGTFIVKGHFEPSYGTAYAYYSVDPSIGDKFNYTIDNFTLHNFVIEKVYSENCEYKVGEVIEIATRGTVMQLHDGFYSASSATGGGSRYVNFKNASLEERTFVISVFPKSKEGKYSEIMRLGSICQNVYESIPDDGRLKSKLAREILAKYN